VIGKRRSCDEGAEPGQPADTAPPDAAEPRGPEKHPPAHPPCGDEEMGGEAPCQLHRWWSIEDDADGADG
jgi:hypothetical protein